MTTLKKFVRVIFVFAVMIVVLSQLAFFVGYSLARAGVDTDSSVVIAIVGALFLVLIAGAMETVNHVLREGEV